MQKTEQGKSYATRWLRTVLTPGYSDNLHNKVKLCDFQQYQFDTQEQRLGWRIVRTLEKSLKKVMVSPTVLVACLYCFIEPDELYWKTPSF
jgi:hypothetical protein